MSAKSKELSGEILSRLDVRAEYEALGVHFTASKPTAKGWIACSAYGRDDKKASAAVHVESGVYKDHGSNLICGLFDFAVHTGEFPDWKAARKHYAIKTKMDKRLPKSETKEDHLLDKFEFNAKWNGFLAKGLILAFPGISDLSLQRAGSQLAHYPRTAPYPHLVVTLPVFGLYLADRPPVGYITMMANGKPLEIYRGKDIPPDYVKRAVNGETGLVNRRGVEMIADGRAELVLKVEGVTGMLAMQAKIPDEWIDKVAVVANACGAQESTLPRLISPVFSGIPVVIIHDADVPGQTGAKVWEGELNKFTSSVNLQLPYVVAEKGGKDLRDWLNEENEFEDLLDLIRRQFPGWLESKGEQQATEIARQDTTEAKPKTKSVQKTIEDVPFDTDNADPDNLVKSLIINRPSPIGGPTEADAPTPPPAVIIDKTISQEAAILKRIWMIVLGSPEGSDDIVAFNTKTGRTFTIKNIANMKYVNLVYHLTNEIEREINQPGAEPIPNRLSFETVRNAIANEGGKIRLTGKSYFGVGIWEFGGRILMVNAGEATIVNGSITKTNVPIQDGKVFDFGSSSKWFDHEWFLKEYEKHRQPGYSQSVFNESVALFDRWDNWGNKRTSEVVSALICATWTQCVWDWRPQACIIGATNSGKTILISTIRNMFCKGEMQVGGMHPTAAGIRQEVKNTMKAIVIDEFERNSKHREDVLATLRGASRGETMSRGTSNQKGLSYTLKHLPWHGAISADFREAADRNRYLMIELLPVAANRGSTLTIPPPDELQDLGLRLMTMAVFHWKRAKEVAGKLKKIYFNGVDRRIVESFSVPCGIIAAANGMSDEDAESLMRDILSDRDFDDQSESDEQSLLKAIYESQVQLDGGKRCTMSMLIKGTLESGSGYGAKEAMYRCGVRRINGKKTKAHPEGEDCIFFCETAIRSNLFTDPAQKGIGIKQILSRIPEAIKDKQQLGGHSPRGITIPLRVIESLMGGNSEKDGSGVGRGLENATATIVGDFSDAFDDDSDSGFGGTSKTVTESW